MKLSEQEKALVGAIEMLNKIAHGHSYSAIEFYERLGRYTRIALIAAPELADDPYYGEFFKGGR